MVQGPELVISAPGGRIGEISIQLGCPHAKHPAGTGVVAGAAVRPAREGPGLGAGGPCGSSNRNGDTVAVRKQIRIRAIRPPAIGDAVVDPVFPVHQEAGFHAAADCRIPLIGGQVKLFHQHAPFGKLPCARLCKGNLFGRSVSHSVIWQGQPALFRRPIRPKWGIHGEGNQSTARREGSQIAKRAYLGERRRGLGSAGGSRGGGWKLVVEILSNRS